jgi:Sigma-70 region 2
MLGPVQDAAGLLQQTLLAARRGPERFDGRTSRQVWRYRIATNRCRNAPRDKGQRPRRLEPLPEPPEPTRRREPIWLEPYPDALLGAAYGFIRHLLGVYGSHQGVSPGFGPPLPGRARPPPSRKNCSRLRLSTSRRHT